MGGWDGARWPNWGDLGAFSSRATLALQVCYVWHPPRRPDRPSESVNPPIKVMHVPCCWLRYGQINDDRKGDDSSVKLLSCWPSYDWLCSRFVTVFISSSTSTCRIRLRRNSVILCTAFFLYTDCDFICRLTIHCQHKHIINILYI